MPARKYILVIALFTIPLLFLYLSFLRNIKRAYAYNFSLGKDPGNGDVVIKNTDTSTVLFRLDSSGSLTVNQFSGNINAANVSSGAFGANTGNGNYSFLNNVGIGTTGPVYPLDISAATTDTSAAYKAVNVSATRNGITGFYTYGGSFTASYGGAGASSSNIYGVFGNANNTSSNSLTGQLIGLYGYTNTTLGSTTTNQKGVYSTAWNQGTLTNNYGVYVDNLVHSGTTTNSYGVYINTLYGTNTYGIYQADATNQNYFAGNVGIGTAGPATKLDVSSGIISVQNSAIALGSGSGYNCGACGSNSTLTMYDAANGAMVFNTGYSTSYYAFQHAGSEQVRISSSGNVGIGTTGPIAKLEVAGGNGTSKIYKEISTGQPDYSYYYLKMIKIYTGIGHGATTFNGKICAERSNDLGVTQCADLYAGITYDGTIYFSENASAPGGSYTPFQPVNLSDGTYTWITLLYDAHTGAGITSWTVDGTIYNSNAADEIGFTQANSTTATHTALTYAARNTLIPYGNVGIGTTGPGAKLDVVGLIRNSAPSAGTVELSGLLPGYADNTYPTLKTSGGNIYFSTGGYYTGYMGNGGIFGMYTTGMANNVSINASGNSWFNGGNVGIGTTGPGYKLEVAGGSAVIRGDIYCQSCNYGWLSTALSNINQSVTTTSNPTFNGPTFTNYFTFGTNAYIRGGGSQFTYGATSIFGTKSGWSGINFGNSAGVNWGTLMISWDGTTAYEGFYHPNDVQWLWYFQNGVLTYQSDRRLKSNIQYLTDTKFSLDKIMQLAPAKFDKINGGVNNLGFIAQDVQNVIPEAITRDPTSPYFGLKTDFFIPHIVNAIKEQQKEIESLQEKDKEIDELSAQVELLKKELKELKKK